MYIFLNSHRAGTVVAAPADEKVRLKVVKHIKQFVPKSSHHNVDGFAFYNSEEEAIAHLNLSPQQIKDLRRGWTIKIRRPAEEFFCHKDYYDVVDALVYTGILYGSPSKARRKEHKRAPKQLELPLPLPTPTPKGPRLV